MTAATDPASPADPAGSTVFDRATIDEYTRAGHWDDETIASMVARHAADRPDAPAFIATDATLTWSAYDALSTRLAGGYALAGLRPGDRIATLLTGGALVHVAYLAAQKAGLVTVGIGPRAGTAEVRHLVRRTRAAVLLTRAVHRGRDAAELVGELRTGVGEADGPAHLTVDLTAAGELTLVRDGQQLALPDPATAAAAIAGRGLGANDLFFLNSTSGTTGLPKCVMQTMNTRKYFGPLAAEAARFGPDEVFASVLPAPYGFGQWSAHVVPTMYGYPTVLAEEFDAEQTWRLIERHRVTVLAAVTSQFVMMLNAAGSAGRDLSSLRVLFTGGERVPADRAARFEQETGCAVLQFYGSNEAGPISVTRADDDRDRRLGTAGRVIPQMRVRLFDADGADVTASGGPGQCAARGPGLTPGYYDDAPANRQLFHPQGWMLTGDLVRIDPAGYLTVTGRVADFIIRGGHNISVLAVEEAVGACGRVAQVAVVPAADDVLGERACAYVVTTDGTDLTLDELRADLAGRGISKYEWPERLVTMDELPLSAGGKTDKARLRADAATRFGKTHPAM
ncbi:class I adenylate-forming enzyme family protein [Micromonospora sp. NBC_01813]|uniref:class I adenylate-forming enzyme family protein n=1 Tax=Micromonospora sp. NBC_01813 TaxID=2975988 RepID=UPI002DD83482|nr:class I adenylate-forming enzyme family protein [Micromonospora sp. NBC_01813]WSA10105.1 acyl--CoA ligase [Micromonospora sp. NBC_01813]